MNISLNSWAKRGICSFDHPNKSFWLHHCSLSFCKTHLKQLPQVALTSTSNCMYWTKEGKYIIIYINWYQMFVTKISNSWQSIKSFFYAFRQAKLSLSFLQFRMTVTSDFNKRPPNATELRWKAVSSFLYCITNNIIVRCCTDTSLDICIFACFKVNCEVVPLHSFLNFKLVISCHRNEFLGAPKAQGLGLGLCINPSLPMSKCYIVEWFIGTFVCSSLYITHLVWCRLRTACCKEQDKEFALIMK